MSRTRTVWLIASGSIVVASALVIAAIRCFGKESVAAFGSVMSFFAAAAAALAAIGYLIETSRIVEATRTSSDEQRRVADMMAADLRFRIAPNLRFTDGGGDVHCKFAYVENIGRGVAVDSVAVITFLPSNRRERIHLDEWLEPHKQRSEFTIKPLPVETGYSIEIMCTDSIQLNAYTFGINADERTTVRVTKKA